MGSDRVFCRLPLEGLKVEAAHVAGTDVVRFDKVAKLFRKEFVDYLVVGDGTVLSAESEALEIAFGALQLLSEFRTARTHVLAAASLTGALPGEERCGEFRFSLAHLRLHLSQLNFEFVQLLRLRRKFPQRNICRF